MATDTQTAIARNSNIASTSGSSEHLLPIASELVCLKRACDNGNDNVRLGSNRSGTGFQDGCPPLAPPLHTFGDSDSRRKACRFTVHDETRQAGSDTADAGSAAAAAATLVDDDDSKTSDLPITPPPSSAVVGALASSSFTVSRQDYSSPATSSSSSSSSSGSRSYAASSSSSSFSTAACSVGGAGAGADTTATPAPTATPTVTTPTAAQVSLNFKDKDKHMTKAMAPESAPPPNPFTPAPLLVDRKWDERPPFPTGMHEGYSMRRMLEILETLVPLNSFGRSPNGSIAFFITVICNASVSLLDREMHVRALFSRFLTAGGTVVAVSERQLQNSRVLTKFLLRTVSTDVDAVLLDVSQCLASP